MNRRFLTRLAAVGGAVIALTLSSSVLASASTTYVTGIRYYGADAVLENTDTGGCTTWIDAHGSRGSDGWTGNSVVVEQDGNCPGGHLLAATPNSDLAFDVNAGLQTASLSGTAPVCYRGDPSNCFKVVVNLKWSGAGAIQTFPGSPGTLTSFGYHIHDHGFTVVVNGAERVRNAVTTGTVSTLGLTLSQSSDPVMFSAVAHEIIVIPF
jgi:hypothetical protein